MTFTIMKKQEGYWKHEKKGRNSLFPTAGRKNLNNPISFVCFSGNYPFYITFLIVLLCLIYLSWLIGIPVLLEEEK